MDDSTEFNVSMKESCVDPPEWQQRYHTWV